MEEWIDWYGYNDGVDYTPQQDSGTSGAMQGGFADTQVDYNAYTPQQDSGTSGAMQGGFADTQADYNFAPQQGTAPAAATPFWDFTFNAAPADYSLGSSTYGMGMGGTGAGLGYSATPSAAPAFGATFGAGSGAMPGLTVGDSGSGQFQTAAAPTQAGITGGMGGSGTTSAMQGGFADVTKQPGLLDKARQGFADLSKFGQDNKDLVKFGSQLAGYLAAKPQQAAAKQATAQQAAVVQENQQTARENNQQAAQSFNEARSLYNPQEMAVRGMAQQTAATQRGIVDLRKQLARRGMSQASIDAEVRRARLGGSTDATAAYTKGLDVGRSAQQSALAAAKNLQTTVPGTDFYGTQATAGQQGAALTSAQLSKLLEDYLGNPTKAAQEARTKAAGVTAR